VVIAGMTTSPRHFPAAETAALKRRTTRQLK
jgi:hypothetical protein